MALNVGSAYGEFRLKLDGFRNDLQTIRSEVRRLSAEPLALPIRPSVDRSSFPQNTSRDPNLLRAERSAIDLSAAQNRAAVAAQRLSTEQVRTSIALTNADAAQQRAALSALRLQQAQERAAAGKTGGGLGPALPRTFAGLSNEALSVARGFVAIQTAQATLDLAKTGASALDVTRSFNNLAGASGRTGAVLLQSMREAAAGTIRDTALMTSASTGLLLTQGRIASELPRLIEIARASAQTTGESVGFIFDSLVKGIARGSPEIIDNAGITLDAAVAFETYAQSIGKTVDQLTKQERQQATLNAVMQSGSEIVKQVGLDNDSAATRIARAEVAVSNLATAFAQRLAPAVASGAQTLADFLSKGDPLAQIEAPKSQLDTTLVQQAANYEDYGRRVAAANAAISASAGPVVSALAGQRAQIEPLSAAQFAYVQSLIARGQSEQQAVASARSLGEVNAYLASALGQASKESQETQQSLAALGPRLLEVAGASDTGRIGVTQLLDSFAIGAVTVPELVAQLAALEAQQYAETTAAQEASNAAALLAQRHGEQTAGTIQAAAGSFQFTSALIQETEEKLRGALAAEQLAGFQSQLASLGMAAASGHISAGQAAAQLAGQYNIATDAALRLVQAQAALAQAKVNAEALADQRAGERSPGASGAAEAARREQARLEAIWRQLERPNLRAQSGGGGGGGRAAGGGGGGGRAASVQQEARDTLAAQEQFARQSERAETQYQQRMLDIARQYAARRREAEESFRSSQLEGRADFYSQLGSIEQNGLRQSLSEQYEQAAQEASRIAQEKGSDVAEKYLSAQAEVILAQGRRLAEIEQAQREDPARAEFLRGVDDLRKKAEQDRLDRITRGEGSIAQDQQRAQEEANRQLLSGIDQVASRSALAAQQRTAESQQAAAAIRLEQLAVDQLGQSYQRVSGREALPKPGGPSPASPTPFGGASADVAGQLAEVIGRLGSILGAIESGTRATQGVQSAVSSLGGRLVQ